MPEPIKASELNDELLVPITVETKKSVERLGVWNSEQITSIDYLPANAPFNQKLFQRLQMTYLNQRAIMESLLLNSGTFKMHEYMDLMQEMEKNMKELEQHYKTQAVALLLVDRTGGTQTIDVKLFDTRELCDFYLRGLHEFSLTDLESNNVPQAYLGSRIFKQEWHCSREQILKNYPNISDVNMNGDNDNGDGSSRIAGEI